MAIRKLTEADLEFVRKWRNALEVRSCMYSTHEIDEAEHRSWFKSLENNPQSLWYIYTDENGSPAGVVYFTEYKPDNKSTFWGFYAKPNAQKGTGTKIGMDSLDEAFCRLKLHKINSEVLAFNKRSISLHERMGFIREGVFRDYHYNGEHFIDVIRFGILRSEWLAKRSEIESRINNFSGVVDM